MRAARLSHVAVVAALSMASVVAITPVGPRPSQIRIVSPAVRLTDASDSILNIAVNLLEDIANIPYNYIQSLNQLADSLFFSASWIVGNSTNIWGADPGDPTHFEVFTNMLLPFPALDAGLDYDLEIFDEAELLTSPSCGTADCSPVVPLEPITGITFIDKLLWTGAVLTGYPFFLDTWFQTPLTGPDSLSTGYTFGDVVDPAGPAYSGFGFTGTETIDGVPNSMPWSDTTVQFVNPLDGFFNSLTAAPTGIETISFSDVYDALMSVLAGLVIDFDPFVPGSPLCPATCDLPPDLTYQAIVEDIYELDPGNTTIEEWLQGYAAGTVNGSTPEQIAFAEQYLQSGFFDFSPDTVAQIDSWLASINPALPALVNNGLLGPSDPNEFLPELAALLGVSSEYTALDDWLTDLSNEIDTFVQTGVQDLSTDIQQALGPGLDSLTLLLSLGPDLPLYLLSLL